MYNVSDVGPDSIISLLDTDLTLHVQNIKIQTFQSDIRLSNIINRITQSTHYKIEVRVKRKEKVTVLVLIED